MQLWLSACCSASGVEASRAMSIKWKRGNSLGMPWQNFCSILLSHLHRFSILSHHFRRPQPPWHTCHKWFEHKWEVPSARKFTSDSWDVRWLLARTEIIRLARNEITLNEVGRCANSIDPILSIPRNRRSITIRWKIDINKQLLTSRVRAEINLQCSCDSISQMPRLAMQIIIRKC